MSEASASDVAIVGMAGRFPGAADVDELWSRVVAGDDCLTELSIDELVALGEPIQQVSRPEYVRRAGVLDDVAGFDAEFFGIGPRDASLMDPQHRHFLECSWAALESAAIVPETFDGAIGVFGGCGMNTYLINNLLTEPGLLDELGWFLVRHTGNDKDFFVNNVAYRLNLTGPAINVQTACSTSLVAVHLAVQSLLAFECDMALAGGATIDVPHGRGYLHAEGEILSPDGRCRAFDTRSGGTVLTSGAGVVVLRRLADALDDGDPVLAVVKGSAVNNDGRRKVGFLAPSVDGHAAVVREALSVAGLSARDIQMIEAHGTGTFIGDPIEVAALTAAFRTWTDDNGFCQLSSTKPNIGHLDTAAGVASLIKMVQSLQHRTFPPLANHSGPSALLDLDRTPFLVSGEAQPWPGSVPRRGGISSLGVGGTNVHVVVEEAPAPPAEPSAQPGCLVFALSAEHPDSLTGRRLQLADFLEGHPEVPLAAVASTLVTGRRAMSRRHVVTARSRDEAVELLRTEAAPFVDTGPPVTGGIRLGFMFPGGGAQYVGMGSNLDDRFTVFHQVRAEATALLVEELGGPDLGPCWDVAGEEAAMRRATISLPATFVTSVALARQWIANGAVPDFFVGHSLGEYAAAHLAGVMSLRDALALVLTRARLMERVGGDDSGMLVVPLPEQEVREMLAPELSIAVVNTADDCVVSGRRAAIESLGDELRARGVETVVLPLAAAAHSALLDEVLDEFGEAVARVRLDAPSIPYPSNVTGSWITAEQATDPAYWVAHLRQTVRFADCLATVLDGQPTVLTEIGPGRALSAFAESSPQPPLAAVPTMPGKTRAETESAFACHAFARLWSCGRPVDLAMVAGPASRRARLPTYPFHHERHWTGPANDLRRGSGDAGAPSGPRRIDALEEGLWRPRWAPLAVRPVVDDFAGRRWLVVGDIGDAFAAEVVAELEHRGARSRLVELPSADSRRAAELLGPDPLDGLVVVAPAGDQGYESSADRWLGIAPGMAVALGAQAESAKLVALTRDALNVEGGSARRAADALAVGLCKVVGREYPHVSGRMVDVDDATAATSVVDELARTGPTVAVLRGGEVFGQTEVVVEERADDQVTPSTGFVTGGAYLVTGGLGGVGFEIAKHLADRHGARVVVTTSEPLPDPALHDRWLARHSVDDPTSLRIRRLRELEAHASKVGAVAVDVSDPSALRHALDRAEELVGRLDGVVHVAGRVHDQLLEFASGDELRFVADVKARAALTFVDELDRRRVPLLVLVSSTSTLVAPEGQVAYVGANAVLEALAGRRGNLRVATIIFGLWSGRGIASALARQHRLGLHDPYPVQHPILDQCADDGTELVMVGRLDPAHHWVVDEHRVLGRWVLPATGHVDLLLTAATAAAEGAVLSQLSLQVPLAGEDGQSPTIRVVVDRANGTVRLESDLGGLDTGGEWTVHSEARYGAPQTYGSEPFDFAEIRARTSISVTDPFEAQRAHLSLGEHWHCFEDVRIGDGVASAVLSLPAGMAVDQDAWLAHPSMLDAAIAVGLAIRSRPGGLHVPTGVALAWTKGPLPDPVNLVVTERRPDVADHTAGADQVELDILALDDDGAVVARLDGVMLRPLADNAWVVEGGSAHEPRVTVRHHRGHETSLVELADELGLRPEEGTTALELLVGSTEDQLIVTSISLDDLDRSVRPPAPDVVEAGDSAAEPREILPALRAIWTDLLGAGAGRDDDTDFFEAGGHSLIAIRLMARIHRELGARLQLSTIFDAPTIRLLAERLEEARPDAASTLVPVSMAGPGRPLFVVHGAGGNVLFLSTFARALAPYRPVYGFQAAGVNHDEDPDASVEKMAERYVAELRRHGPGPYLLGGYSGGGTVALEMARQLVEAGEQVDTVVLFDSVPPGKADPPPRVRRGNLARHLLRHGPGPLLDHVRRVLSWRFGARRVDRSSVEIARLDADAESHGFVDLFDHFSAVSESYRLRPYPVDVLLVKADEVWPTQPEDYYWGPHVRGKLTVRTAPGNHITMFSADYAGHLAELVEPHLGDAEAAAADSAVGRSAS